MGQTLSETAEESIGKAKPFVKWAGGKRGIIHELTSRLPEKFDDYYEPFVGGGALFFEIAHKLTNAYLSDFNLELVITYQVIKKQPDRLIETLKRHSEKHNKSYYYQVRSQHRLEDAIEIAGRLIYLNKTCYNGLYRVNRSGQFNVPIGKYDNPNIVQERNIRACHEALQCAKIEYKEFEKIAPPQGHFVYCDPPYHARDENSFTNYTPADFTEEDHTRLRDFALALHKKGVYVMLSNSNTEYIGKLYENSIFNIKIIHAPRYVSCKANEREPVDEVIITNY